MDKTIILNKIKSHYGFKKDSDLARFLEISPQTFSNWKKRNSYDPQLIYTKCPEINSDWLLTGKGPMLKDSFPDRDFPLPVTEDPYLTLITNKLQNIPVYDLDSNGGLRNVLQKDSAQTFISNFIKVPNLGECDGASYIKGDSMLPLFKNGDIIIFKSISPEDIFWGELYLVEITLDDHSNFTAIRHLRKSELGDQHIKLVSENPAYEPKDVPINKINAIALIRASIRFH
jgi:phage repressor protein C with HTH and peptisase S24 domain